MSIILNVIIQSVIKVSVIKVNAIMLNIFMLSVIGPLKNEDKDSIKCNFQTKKN
jgi:hypothetical protein